MDNKITKKRLSHLLAYEWITVLLAMAAAIVCWALLFSVTSVQPTVGQAFKYYLDENINGQNQSEFYDGLAEGSVFSYDVLTVSSESLLASTNVLSVRLSIYEGDVIISSTDDTDVKNGAAEKLVDDYTRMYDLDKLNDDAAEYLAKFLKDEFNRLDGEEKKSAARSYSNLDEDKIDARFSERMKGDNRFKTDAQKKEGKQKERDRIKNLCEQATDFNRLLTERSDIFFTYTRYEQSAENAKGTDDEASYRDLYEQEVAAGRKDVKYGLRLDKFSETEKKGEDPSHFFRADGKADATGITVLAFDFLEQQPDLQFEVISFMNHLVRRFSTILD